MKNQNAVVKTKADKASTFGWLQFEKKGSKNFRSWLSKLLLRWAS